MKLVQNFLKVVGASLGELRARISEVKLGPVEDGKETILFSLDGVKHKGVLAGRNADLCLGFGEEQDKGIAVRVLLDGHAEKIK